ncbi:MAG: hypothetical protein KBC41_01490 [Candidatus Pacebacteria bacterium]|nr:hypothetical protein [Candidatus Paceibacterota bacterium]
MITENTISSPSEGNIKYGNNFTLGVNITMSGDIEFAKKSTEMKRIVIDNPNLEVYLTLENPEINNRVIYHIYDTKRNWHMYITSSYSIDNTKLSSDQISYTRNVYKESIKSILPIINSIKNTNNVVYPIGTKLKAGGV